MSSEYDIGGVYHFLNGERWLSLNFMCPGKLDFLHWFLTAGGRTAERTSIWKERTVDNNSTQSTGKRSMSQLNFSVVTVPLQPKPLRQNIHSIFPYPLIFKGHMFPRECTFFLFHFIISLRFKDTTDTVKPLCPAKFTI